MIGKIEKKLDFLTAGGDRIMLNDSFVQSYQSVAWQDDCADVIVHSSKFSPQRYVRYYDKADNIIIIMHYTH